MLRQHGALREVLWQELFTEQVRITLGPVALRHALPVLLKITLHLTPLKPTELSTGLSLESVLLHVIRRSSVRTEMVLLSGLINVILDKVVRARDYPTMDDLELATMPIHRILGGLAFLLSIDL